MYFSISNNRGGEVKGPGLTDSTEKWSYPTVDFSGQFHFSEVTGAEKKIVI